MYRLTWKIWSLFLRTVPQNRQAVPYWELFLPWLTGSLSWLRGRGHTWSCTSATWWHKSWLLSRLIHQRSLNRHLAFSHPLSTWSRLGTWSRYWSFTFGFLHSAFRFRFCFLFCRGCKSFLFGWWIFLRHCSILQDLQNNNRWKKSIYKYIFTIYD